jgi:hypothetical protein
MKTHLIQYLNNPRDGNALVLFMEAWIRAKIPNRSTGDVHMFIDLFMHGLINVPMIIDSRYHDALQYMIDQAMAELHVTEVHSRDKQILKYI